MATVNQIFQLINDVAKESLGTQAVSAKDTSTLVSLGDTVLSSAQNTDAFYHALVDRIGYTAIAVREYRAKERSVRRSDMDWGIIYQKISFDRVDAKANPSWNLATPSDPFDVTKSTVAYQKLFSKMGTWSYEDVIPDFQLHTAFTSPERMGAFISGIYLNIENSLQEDEENVSNLAVSTNIAGVVYGGKSTQVRNLLTEFNTNLNPGTALTRANCLANNDFLAFACREILMVTDFLQKPSRLYNVDGMKRHTPISECVVELLSSFDSAITTYLRSNTFHEKLIKMPRYETVPYWQGTGTTVAFGEISKVAITNDFDTTTDGNETVTQDGIIAFVHDIESCASIITRMRDHSIYNPRQEVLNIFKKADKGYMVDLSENAVVFHI